MARATPGSSWSLRAPGPGRTMADGPDVTTIEPTGQLDAKTGVSTMRLPGSAAADGTTAVVATHDPLLLDIADQPVGLRDGRLEIVR